MTSLLAASLLVACSPGNGANFSVHGELDGRPIDLGITLNAGGGAVALDDDQRPVARSGGRRELTVIRADVCPTEPCPDVATLTLRGPEGLLGGGTVVLDEGSALTLQKADAALATIALGRAWSLAFEEPTFSTFGPTVLRQRARFLPGPAPSMHLALEGTVDLEYQCTGSSDVRFCGGPISDAVIDAPYTRDECPRELVAPFEVARQWSGTTLRLGELTTTCRRTERGVLCHARREAVAAAGCTWNVHFLTDGSGQHFSVAGWPERGCALPACLTAR